MDRRRFLTGLTALIVAPSIVRVSSIMPIKVIDPSYARYISYYQIYTEVINLRIYRPLHIPMRIESTKDWRNG